MIIIKSIGNFFVAVKGGRGEVATAGWTTDARSDERNEVKRVRNYNERGGHKYRGSLWLPFYFIVRADSQGVIQHELHNEIHLAFASVLKLTFSILSKRQSSN